MNLSEGFDTISHVRLSLLS